MGPTWPYPLRVIVETAPLGCSWKEVNEGDTIDREKYATELEGTSGVAGENDKDVEVVSSTSSKYPTIRQTRSAIVK